ncbi:Crp/Fnr family transcriptional regulator [Bacillus sp. FJAT-42315]|uniref:Crp/Fnr family transcriptional regulator n=1 Tax=Bacillus sp. FJAT-42315 TaxID=2014077 RepID=UPI000C236239|nr:Crp/Fnr family transcriptional regulator [Bacillus sp. FJAT-42315]
MNRCLSLSEKFVQLFEEENTVKLFRKGDHLFQEATEAKELFLLLSGKVQISKVVPDGRELSLRICGKDDIIVEFPLFTGDTQYSSNAKALENGEALVMTKKRLEEMISSDSQLMMNWFQYTQLDNQKTQSKLRDLILHGKKGGVYSTLIRLSNTFGEQTEDGILITVTLTNQEIANLCGTSREVVNRMFSDLRKKNILSIKKSQLIIHDIQYLKKEIDCENCPIEICQID